MTQANHEWSRRALAPVRARLIARSINQSRAELRVASRLERVRKRMASGRRACGTIRELEEQ